MLALSTAEGAERSQEGAGGGGGGSRTPPPPILAPELGGGLQGRASGWQGRDLLLGNLRGGDFSRGASGCAGQVGAGHRWVPGRAGTAWHHR